jgi:hypothetical protein
VCEGSKVLAMIGMYVGSLHDKVMNGIEAGRE